MKKNDLAEIKKIDIFSLEEKIAKVREEISKALLDKSVRKLTNVKDIKNKRKNLALMLTILKQKLFLQKLEEEHGTE